MFVRSRTQFICEVPPETRLIVFEGRVIAAGPNCPTSFVTDKGLVEIKALETRHAVMVEIDRLGKVRSSHLVPEF